jgi:glyoxylase-like metal-dependent hydrolase (beta-lactamase superfamily II)
MITRHVLLAALAMVTSFGAHAQNRAAPPSAPRIYIFDTGGIQGLDPALFNFKREELKEVDFVNRAYLIVHPRGTLMFDTGGIPDGDFKGDGKPVVEGVQSSSKPLLPQLAAAGYKPSDINYLAMSHYHSDHTANSNAFARATWIVQKAERDFMFQDKPPEGTIIRRDSYEKLAEAETKILDNENFDVFGDGTVVLMSAPGHTPGHQVLAVKLARRGTVVLAGDLYHYPEERTTGRVPTFEFDVEQSRASRAQVEQFVKDNRAELWIEHDKATHAALPLAPRYVD